MATEKLIIAYAGSLIYFDPEHPEKKTGGSYRVGHTDFSTRSAYYLFRGLAELQRRRPGVEKQLTVCFWGLVDKRVQQQAEQMGIAPLVSVSGYKEKADSLRSLQQADILFLTAESPKAGQRPLLIPLKMFEYLAMRKPLLLLAGPSDCADILRAAGVGIFADPFDPGDVADCLGRLVDSAGRMHELVKPDEAVIASYSFDRLTEKLVAIFDDLNQASA